MSIRMKYRLKDGVYHRENGGFIQLIEFDTDRHYFELDAYAARTLKLLLEKKDESAIAEIICSESGQSRDVVLSAVMNILGMLLSHGLIEESV